MRGWLSCVSSWASLDDGRGYKPRQQKKYSLLIRGNRELVVVNPPVPPYQGGNRELVVVNPPVPPYQGGNRELVVGFHVVQCNLRLVLGIYGSLLLECLYFLCELLDPRGCFLR